MLQVTGALEWQKVGLSKQRLFGPGREYDYGWRKRRDTYSR